MYKQPQFADESFLLLLQSLTKLHPLPKPNGIACRREGIWHGQSNVVCDIYRGQLVKMSRPDSPGIVWRKSENMYLLWNLNQWIRAFGLKIATVCMLPPIGLSYCAKHEECFANVCTVRNFSQLFRRVTPSGGCEHWARCVVSLPGIADSPVIIKGGKAANHHLITKLGLQVTIVLYYQWICQLFSQMILWSSHRL